VRVVQWPDAPDGGDIADYMKDPHPARARRARGASVPFVPGVVADDLLRAPGGNVATHTGPLGIISAVDLMALDLAEPVYIVDAVLTAGGTLFGGKPKHG
jgi:hypothetical protein